MVPLGSWAHNVTMGADARKLQALYRKTHARRNTQWAERNHQHKWTTRPSGSASTRGRRIRSPATADSGTWRAAWEPRGLDARTGAGRSVRDFHDGLGNRPPEAVGGPQAPLIATDPRVSTRYIWRKNSAGTSPHRAGGTAPMYSQWRATAETTIPDATKHHANMERSPTGPRAVITVVATTPAAA